MFDQHLHCIVYTSRRISWVTMSLTAYEPTVICRRREQTFSYCFSVRLCEGLRGLWVNEHGVLHVDIYISQSLKFSGIRSNLKLSNERPPGNNCQGFEHLPVIPKAQFIVLAIIYKRVTMP